MQIAECYFIVNHAEQFVIIAVKKYIRIKVCH
jgi:hypothetical protein